MARPPMMPGYLRLLVLCIALFAAVSPAHATPFVWDQDTDRLDDRVETVNLDGYSFAFENGDSLGRQRIQVGRVGGGLVYGVFVVFDHVPTASDLLSLTLLGLPVLHRYESIPAVRSQGSFVQVAGAAGLAGVERVEAVPVLDAEVVDGAASIGVRDAGTSVFPTWVGTGGADGSGVVVAFLDTGINDAADGPYPGHESLLGRCVGGASFVQLDSTSNTPRDGSVNPADHGGEATQSHGTHVAGIALGTGGASGYARGVAPGARFVDVKVLSDAGSGIAVADGIDWCIHNRSRNWGVVGYSGIQVLNLSLSSPDLTDGNDVVSRLADRAAELGIVVVASIGNAGHPAHVPSPAGASRAIAVGAMDTQRSPGAADDQWASFNNTGPRAGNGDASPLDELKPDLLAPGVAVLSADGSLLSDGCQYQRLSGTSMAAAFVSGAAALLRSAYPSITPTGVAELLRATARRELGGVPVGSAGADPRWRSTIGFGVVDLYAARLEREQPARTQVVRLGITAAVDSVIALISTQRERGTAALVIERAADVSGVPSAFAPYDSLPASGDSSLAGVDNREVYRLARWVPPAERGVPFWYRVSFSEAGVRHDSPTLMRVGPAGSPVATIELTIVHNAYDTDVTGSVSRVGTGPGLPLPGSSAAISSDWIIGTSTAGNISRTFHIEVPHGTAGLDQPPSTSVPWRLRVEDGGFLNRFGRVTDYRVIWHGGSGDVTYEGMPLPLVTVEGQAVHAIAPHPLVAVEEPRGVAAFRLGPNPVVSGGVVTFDLPPDARMLDVVDLSGRRMARVTTEAAGDRARATWQVRDRSGRPLAPGIYLAFVSGYPARRLVVLGR